MSAVYMLVDKDRRVWNHHETVDTVIGVYSNLKDLLMASISGIEEKEANGTYCPEDLVIYEISKMNANKPSDNKRLGCAKSIVRLFDRSKEHKSINNLFEIFSNDVYSNLVLLMFKEIILPEYPLSKKEKIQCYKFLLDCEDILEMIDGDNSMLRDLCKVAIHIYEKNKE